MLDKCPAWDRTAILADSNGIRILYIYICTQRWSHKRQHTGVSQPYLTVSGFQNISHNQYCILSSRQGPRTPTHMVTKWFCMWAFFHATVFWNNKTLYRFGCCKLIPKVFGTSTRGMGFVRSLGAAQRISLSQGSEDEFREGCLFVLMKILIFDIHRTFTIIYMYSIYIYRF